MKLIAKSLGVKCGDCHQEGDFAAPTRRKKIAAQMWDEFAAKLVAGRRRAPLFCDSCHQGRTTLLDRRDKKALVQVDGRQLRRQAEAQGRQVRGVRVLPRRHGHALPRAMGSVDRSAQGSGPVATAPTPGTALCGIAAAFLDDRTRVQ